MIIDPKVSAGVARRPYASSHIGEMRVCFALPYGKAKQARLRGKV